MLCLLCMLFFPFRFFHFLSILFLTFPLLFFVLHTFHSFTSPSISLPFFSFPFSFLGVCKTRNRARTPWNTPEKLQNTPAGTPPEHPRTPLDGLPPLSLSPKPPSSPEHPSVQKIWQKITKPKKLVNHQWINKCISSVTGKRRLGQIDKITLLNDFWRF